jgi:NTP pyrophosphatase (non-canonical NTP hydrolase)
MTKEQFLLLKLAEECAEVAQRCSKQIQFGKHEVQNGQALTNGERLKNEIKDLMVLVTMLEEIKEIPEIDNFSQAHINKRIKLQKYLDLSTQLGMLPEIKL